MSIFINTQNDDIAKVRQEMLKSRNNTSSDQSTNTDLFKNILQENTSEEDNRKFIHENSGFFGLSDARKQMIMEASRKEMRDYVFSLLNKGKKYEEAEKLTQQKYPECTTNMFVAFVNEWHED